MEATDATLLDCCEAAFLFDLAVEDVWCKAMHDLADHTTITTAAAVSERDAASAGELPRHAAHRPTPDVRWSTLQVLLRYACTSCSAIHSVHDMDQYIVSALLIAKPQTAAAVVQARERYVGKRVNTCDLVRLVARAAPLCADALTAVRGAFAALLKVEKKAACLVQEEVQARGAVAADESADRKCLAAAVLQAHEAARQATLMQQRAASLHVLQAALQPVAAVIRTGVHGHDATVTSQPLIASSSQTLLNNSIGAALHDARCEAEAVHEALRAASAAICDPTTFNHPLMRDVVQHVDERERRLATLEERVRNLQAMVRRLRCVRCGRRLRQLVRGRGAVAYTAREALSRSQPSAPPGLTKPDNSLRDLFDALRACVGTAPGPVRTAVPLRVTTEQLTQLLFESLAHLNAEAVGSSDAVPSTGRAPLQERVTQPSCSPAPPRRPPLHVVTFPVLEYFCEHGEWFTDAVELPARWGVFAHYAVLTSRPADGSAAALHEGDSDSAWSWVWQSGLTRTGFSAFLSDLAACDAADGEAGGHGVALRDFLVTLVLPRWVEAPLLCEAAQASG